jgi:hypothetical protein
MTARCINRWVALAALMHGREMRASWSFAPASGFFAQVIGRCGGCPDMLTPHADESGCGRSVQLPGTGVSHAPAQPAMSRVAIQPRMPEQ